jgi:hypothetical protein
VVPILGVEDIVRSSSSSNHHQQLAALGVEDMNLMMKRKSRLLSPYKESCAGRVWCWVVPVDRLPLPLRHPSTA